MSYKRQTEDWISTFLKYTDNSEPPESYKKWTAISVIAACMQRKVYLNWEGQLFPNLYIVLVGPSGVRKGTAMRPGRQLLDEVGVAMSAEATTREALIRRIQKSGQFDQKSLSMDLHSSMTIFSQELTVFLGYSNMILMADLCDWYDCHDEWTYDTKGAGTDYIKKIWVNLIGATTPPLLQSTLPQDAIGGGLTSRMIFVYETKRGKIVPAPFVTDEERKLKVLLATDLADILQSKGQFKITEGFLDSWLKWYPLQTEDKNFGDPRFSGYAMRKPTHILKLSMIMNMSRHDGDMKITADDLSRAIETLGEIEINMPLTFRGVGRAELADVMYSVMATIANKGQVMKSNLLRMHYYDATESKMQEILDTLCSMKFCTISMKDGTIKYNEDYDKEGEDNATVIKGTT